MALTKLMEWILGAAAFVGLWAMLVANAAQPANSLHQYEFLILPLPLILLVLFGVYAASVVLYRVFTFNNCEEASAELTKQIKEAREDLKRRGFVFEKKSQ